MSVIEKFAQISQTVSKMINFCLSDAAIANEVQSYARRLQSLAENGHNNEDEILLSFIISGRI